MPNEPQTFFDRRGRAIDFTTARQLFSDKHYVQVALSHFDNGLALSTVWLGHDAGSSWVGVELQDRAPIIFETALFRGARLVDVLRRYFTEAHAVECHHELREIIEEKIREGTNIEKWLGA